MEFHHILVALLSSSAVLGIMIFAAKKIIEHTVKYNFEKLNERIKKELEVVSRIKEDLVRSQINAYEELSRIIYQLRNAVRDIVKNNKKLDESDLLFLSNELGMSLYAAKFYLDPPLFDEVHKYKIRVQEIILAIESKVNEDKQKDDIIQSMFAEIDRLHREVVECMQADVKFKTQLFE